MPLLQQSGKAGFCLGECTGLTWNCWYMQSQHLLEGLKYFTQSEESNQIRGTIVEQLAHWGWHMSGYMIAVY
jgi:hypothetical protein